MKIYRSLERNSDEYRRLLCRGSDDRHETSAAVESVCRGVRERGDSALVEYTSRFDGVRLERLRVDAAEVDRAVAEIAPEILDAIRTASEHIRTFHAAQRGADPTVETLPGVRCWRERRPIGCVGLYVPAGSAPLPSTMLMLGVPATLAACPRIVVCSPPAKDGRVNAHVLAAASLLGITEVYSVGGAQAIAAMAYGTESIPRVDKIFGPGNRFVAAAKRLVASEPNGPAVDLVAGPSELLVVADDTANPEHVAADLLSQAEHDPDAQVVLVTPDESLAIAVMEALERQLATLTRGAIATRALETSYVVICRTMGDAMQFSNDYAPEHLIVNARDAKRLVGTVDSAGSVFVGPWAPVTAGDYASGTNHTLPTGGSARSGGGLSLESFQKIISFQEITRKGLDGLAPTLTLLASLEGLDGHGRAVTIRTEAPVTDRSTP